MKTKTKYILGGKLALHLFLSLLPPLMWYITKSPFKDWFLLLWIINASIQYLLYNSYEI